MTEESDPPEDPPASDALWRDIARMEAEVADPDEGETRHYQRDEMKDLIAQAKKRVARSKARGAGGALGLPRREGTDDEPSTGDEDKEATSAPTSGEQAKGEAEEPASSPADDEQSPSSVEAPSSFDGEVPSIPGVEDDDDDDPTQIAPRQAMKAAARKRKKARAEQKKTTAKSEDEGSSKAPKKSAPPKEEVSDEASIEAAASSGGGFGWVLWVVLGGVIAAVAYALRG